MFNEESKTRHYNLTKKESEALNWLSDGDDIIIKSSDKGGGVCVWGKEKYVAEAMRQLQNTQYYSQLSLNPMANMKKELEELVNTAKDEYWISKKEYDFLLYPHPRITSFTMLPKVHKNLENPPGRPIISSNSMISEPLSKFVD